MEVKTNSSLASNTEDEKTQKLCEEQKIREENGFTQGLEPDTEDGLDAQTLAQWRELSYRLFSSLFGGEVTIDFLREASHLDSELQGPLGAYFASLDESQLEEQARKAAAEYARLFLNMSAHPVVLFESVYTSPKRLLMQEARDEVRAAYHDQGLSLAQGKNLPEDHLSFELEFMAQLCAKEAACKEAGDESGARAARLTQAEFLSEHLFHWVFEVCDEIAQKAKTELYQNLGRALEEFMSYERALIQEGTR